MAEGQLKEKDAEELAIDAVIVETLRRLDIPGSDFHLRAPDNQAWKLQLAMPSQFLGHCWQALLSNAARHRDAGTAIELETASRQTAKSSLDGTTRHPKRTCSARRKSWPGERMSRLALPSRGRSRASFSPQSSISQFRNGHAVSPTRLRSNSVRPKPKVFFALDMLELRRKRQDPDVAP